MLARIRALSFHSATIAWSYCVGLLGAGAAMIDEVADALGDPGIKEQISAAIGDPRMTGRILLGISIITIFARLRTIRRSG